ncbi:MAG: hypothetical protein AVDCRST_MAG90-1100, partial [uncultured Microvirga sp.]
AGACAGDLDRVGRAADDRGPVRDGDLVGVSPRRLGPRTLGFRLVRGVGARGARGPQPLRGVSPHAACVSARVRVGQPEPQPADLGAALPALRRDRSGAEPAGVVVDLGRLLFGHGCPAAAPLRALPAPGAGHGIMGAGPRGVLGHLVSGPDLRAARPRGGRGLAPARARLEPLGRNPDRARGRHEAEFPGLAGAALSVRPSPAGADRGRRRRRDQRHPARRLRGRSLSAMVRADRLRSRARVLSDEWLLRGSRGPRRDALARPGAEPRAARRPRLVGLPGSAEPARRERPRARRVAPGLAARVDPLYAVPAARVPGPLAQPRDADRRASDHRSGAVRHRPVHAAGLGPTHD